ncbi:hypothetical protein HY994_06790 [Candidatus Micrarchaeota archaeon]|nr:hypothetical protein [Candidatus Micrarchaeota archaeon]
MSRPDFALDRIHVEPIPEEIMNLVSDWLDAHGPFKYKEDAQDPHHRYMGSLGFTVENEKATTAFKFPKSSSEDAHAIILRNGAPRWGSHLEALCVKHLEDKGVRFISSGNHPSEDVIQVLEKAGLSAYKDFQIKEWYEKLEAFYQNRRTR